MLDIHKTSRTTNTRGIHAMCSYDKAGHKRPHRRRMATNKNSRRLGTADFRLSMVLFAIRKGSSQIETILGTNVAGNFKPNTHTFVRRFISEYGNLKG